MHHYAVTYYESFLDRYDPSILYYFVCILVQSSPVGTGSDCEADFGMANVWAKPASGFIAAGRSDQASRECCIWAALAALAAIVVSMTFDDSDLGSLILLC